jgi:hypothetical protein
MLETVKQGIDERLALEEVVPLGVVEVSGDEGGLATIAIVHEFEKGIDLFGLQGQISQFVNDQDVIATETPKELGGGAVGQGGIEGVEEVLGMVETASVAVEQGLAQQANGQSRLAGAGRADEDDILCALHEVEAGQAEDVGLAEFRTSLKGKGLKSLVPREFGLSQAVGQAALLAVAGFFD